ncbi:MAG: NifU N-terminal domain-containing protein [Armatimonadota bacterium]|nr:NifU N-terminal domain-containing protein [Armatimonadota bacterium]MDR5697411.1 NifU N-terminal domain-containing protein [Armatimonadota bacterium]
MRIDVQPTPNVHALKFILDRRVTEGKSQTYTAVEQAAEAPLARRLLSVPGVRMVFLLNDFITLTRDPDADWNAIVPEAERIIREHYRSEGD